MDGDLPKIIGAFLTDSASILGHRELLIAAAAGFAIIAAAMWLTAKLVDRKERHLTGAISAGLMGVLMAALLGSAYLAFLIKGVLANGRPPEPTTLYLCALVAAVLMWILVHGGFGTAWWQTLILLIALAGSIAGAGMVAQKIISPDKLHSLSVLAAQVSGMKTEGPSLIQSEQLKKVAASRTAEVERKDLKRRQNALHTTYASLQQERSKLNMSDAAAVNAFNQHAADYHKEKQYVTARLAEIEAVVPVTAAAK